MKECPKCSALIAASETKCPFCNHLFPRQLHEEKNGVLVEIVSQIPIGLKNKRISQLTIEELIALQKVKKYKASYIWRCVRARGKLALSEYAKQMQYESYWLMMQMRKMKDSKYSDYIIT